MRKLILLTVGVLAALAFTASAASAAVEVRDPGTQEACPATIPDPGDVEGPVLEIDVTGGCVVEGFEGSFGLYWMNDQLFGSFTSYFDLHVASDGGGFAVNQWVYTDGWGREPCEDVDGSALAWPVEFRSVGGGEFQADVEMCLQGVDSPGGGTSPRTVVTDVTSFGGVGSTVLDQVAASGEMYQNGYWESAETVDLVDVE